MLHRTFIRSFASFSTAAVALLAGSPAYGQGSTETRCTWSDPGGPSTTIMYTPWTTTDVGTLWDTKERKCTTTSTGNVTWCTWARTRTCTQSCGFGVSGENPTFTCGWTYGYSDAPPTCTTAPATGKKCVKQSSCLWTSETEVPVQSAEHVVQRDSQRAIPAQPSPSVLVFNIVKYMHEGLVNQWASSTVMFDGRVVPFNGAVALDRHAPGPHVYTVTPSPSLGFPFRMLRFNIDLQYSSTLTNTSSSFDTVPIATVRYTNNSPYDQFVDFTVAPQQIGLVAELQGNQFSVPAGGSVDLTVEFYTQAGYVLESGHQYTARVDAHAITPTGTLYATGQAIGVEPAAADVNADGNIDLADLRDLFGTIGMTADRALGYGVRGDLTRDGMISVADVRELFTLMSLGHN